MEKQKILFANGNELAACAARQIRYHVMGYYPITPSTQVAENLDLWRAEGKCDIRLIAAEGEHSAAGVCYGASAAGGRVFGATSANGLLYALEEMPVQSGTRMPMVMNVACRTVSGPLCIKGDHSDIMYLLNAGWLIFFAPRPQAVYDMNLMALKLAEEVCLPAAVAYDGFFTSHQKRKCQVFEEDKTVQDYIGKWERTDTALNLKNPVTIGSYMGEKDILQNKYELHRMMEYADARLDGLFAEYEGLSGRRYRKVEGYRAQDAEYLLVLLGSSFETAKEAVDRLRSQNVRAGALTLQVLRPFPAKELWEICRHAKCILVGDRQDSYGAGGGNLSLEVRAALQRFGFSGKIRARVYGLGGTDFFVEDALELFALCRQEHAEDFGYYGVVKEERETCVKRETAAEGSGSRVAREDVAGAHCGPDSKGTGASLSAAIGRTAASGQFPADGQTADAGQTVSNALDPKETLRQLTVCTYDPEKQQMQVKGGTVRDTLAMPKRLSPGHGACPGCGIPVNLNLLMRGIEGNVVFVFHTGCGMVVTTAYPKTSFRVPYVHNLFQNGPATMGGIIAVFEEKQKRGEMPKGDITFVMVSGDGGMDIGLGSALGAACRNQKMILFEYDNGGYMNTGYQLSYSTPYGAKSSTSHVGKEQFGKSFFQRDTAQIMAAAGVCYVATVAESNPADFIQKAAKASACAKEHGMAYVKALSVCPLNWNSEPAAGREAISAAVDCCFFPLYEVEQGITRLSYDPEALGKKIPVTDWLSRMGRTKHLLKEQYNGVTDALQKEIDRRYTRLKARAADPVL